MFDSQIVSRWFFEPSSHAIPTDKTELVVKAPWGHVQLWRDLRYRAGPSRRSDGELLILRFLGSRGRAELATADPGDRLESLGAEVWTVNPPGFGASTGPTSLARYAHCALVAADAILAHAEGRPVWVYGKSIGASAALLVAAERPIDCLIVKNAVPVERLLARRHGWWNPSLLASLCIPSDLNCMHNARHSGARNSMRRRRCSSIS